MAFFGRASRFLGGVALILALARSAPAETLPAETLPAGTLPTETLHIGGTGAATAPLQQIAVRFTAESGIAVEVIPGLGTSGGLNAAADGVLQLVVSARVPSAIETARELTTFLTTCTPYVLASSHPSPGSLASKTIAAIYAQGAPVWPDGTPIRIVLRPKAETDNAVMAALFPGIDQALAQARSRDVVPIGTTDQDNADLAEHIPGSLIGSTYAQLLTEHRALPFVAIDGELPDLDAYEAGRYPFGKRLYIIGPRHPKPEASRFLDFLGSPRGITAMRETGLVACPP